MAYKVKSSKEVYRNYWMWVTEDNVQTEFGDNLMYSVVHKYPFVILIPWDGTKITIVGQYRYSIDSYSWEFPMGHTDGKDVLVSAKAELQEEVGLVANNLVKIGDYFLAPGHCDQVGHVFLATDLSATQTDHRGAEKGMKIKKVTLKEFDNMIINGEIKDGPTLSAYTLLNLSKYKIST